MMISVEKLKAYLNQKHFNIHATKLLLDFINSNQVEDSTLLKVKELCKKYKPKSRCGQCPIDKAGLRCDLFIHKLFYDKDYISKVEKVLSQEGE